MVRVLQNKFLLDQVFLYTYFLELKKKLFILGLAVEIRCCRFNHPRKTQKKTATAIQVHCSKLFSPHLLSYVCKSSKYRKTFSHVFVPFFLSLFRTIGSVQFSREMNLNPSSFSLLTYEAQRTVLYSCVFLQPISLFRSRSYAKRGGIEN